MSLRGGAAIAGVAELPPRRTTPGATTLTLLARVARLAVADAGMEPAAIDGLLVAPHLGETPQHVPATVAEYLGLRPRYAGMVDLGGASGAGMVWRAAAAIAAGMCETVLGVLAHARDPERRLRATNRNPIREFEVPYGASGANQAYAMIARRHMSEHGTTPEQLATVPVAQRRNAQLNPDAIFHGVELTVEDVLRSPIVMDPLHLFEIVMPCGGGAAFVLSSAQRARSLCRPPVLLLGAGEKVTHRGLAAGAGLDASPLAAAVDSAYADASVGPADLDLLSLYDCYSIVVAIALEDSGLVEKGRAGPWLADHDLSPHGDHPVNTHGGQLSMGQADLAGGLTQVIETVRQLRGEAGARQVPGAQLGLVTGSGATMSEHVALVLGADS